MKQGPRPCGGISRTEFTAIGRDRQVQEPSGDHFADILRANPEIVPLLEEGDVTAWQQVAETVRTMHRAYASPGKICRATKAKPGTAEKVEVLRERVRSGETLWNESDPAGVAGCDMVYTENGIKKFVEVDKCEE